MPRLYACLAAGGTLDGVRLLSPRTIERARRCLGRGWDPYLSSPTAFGTGFQLQTDVMAFGPEPTAFGHPGAGGSTHGAWPELRTGFSYAMNAVTVIHAGDTRGTDLLAALHDAVRARRR
jgi:CubicO group peptidase (beta-lactamase class C family)